MRLPFVSRGRYEDAIDRLRIRDAEYTGLLADFKALRLQGASKPESAPVLERKEPDQVMLAISEAAGSDSVLRGLMVREATHARRIGISDADIISNIERGVSVDDGLPA